MKTDHLSHNLTSSLPWPFSSPLHLGFLSSNLSSYVKWAAGPERSNEDLGGLGVKVPNSHKAIQDP